MVTDSTGDINAIRDWGGAAAPLTPGYGESRFQRESDGS
jgi:hypothetical protein